MQRLASAFAVLVAFAQLGRADTEEQRRFFESRIRPLLAENCYRCHGAERQRGDLRLDSAAAIRRGGSSAIPIVVAGQPNKMIAFRLKIAIRTVEIHRARVMEKTGARNLSELVRMAIRLED